MNELELLLDDLDCFRISVAIDFYKINAVGKIGNVHCGIWIQVFRKHGFSKRVHGRDIGIGCCVNVQQIVNGIWIYSHLSVGKGFDIKYGRTRIGQIILLLQRP